MKPAIRPHTNDEDELLAELTDIAYRVLLRQGLRRPFVDVELELWDEIRRAYRQPRGAIADFERRPQLSLSLASK